MSSSRKDVTQLIRVAKEQGWTVSWTRKNHLRWQSPSGQIIFSPSTPSESRSVPNTKSQLRKAGLVL